MEQNPDNCPDSRRNTGPNKSSAGDRLHWQRHSWTIASGSAAWSELRLDRRVAARVDPSDVLQDAFMDASQQLDQYVARPPMPLFLWLRFLTGQRLMAIHRQHLGAQKRDARQEVALNRPAMPEADSLSLSCGLLGQVTSPSMAAFRGELQVRLQETVDRLDPLDREILALRHYEELTNQEAAWELGITPAAASKRYIRALERLKAVLAEARIVP